MKTIKQAVHQKIKHNLSLIRFNWWLNKSENRSLVVGCLCEMCHQNRKVKPGLTPSSYDGWCDDCFCDLPLWLKFKRTSPEELEELKAQQEQAAISQKEKREKKAKNLASKAGKRQKLTGFENVEEETEREVTIENRELVKSSIDANVEKQRQRLESIYLYEGKDD